MMKLLLLVFVVLSGCEPIVNLRGNDVEHEIKNIQVGTATKNDVLKICGSPSIYSDANTWIYVGGQSEVTSFSAKNKKENFVVRIKFNVEGIVNSIDKIDQ